MKQTFLKSRGHRYMEYIDKVRLNNLKIKTSSALIAPPPFLVEAHDHPRRLSSTIVLGLYVMEGSDFV